MVSYLRRGCVLILHTGPAPQRACRKAQPRVEKAAALPHQARPSDWREPQPCARQDHSI